MINAPPRRPIQNKPPQTLESLHIYLLLVLGIAFVGGGLTVLGFVGHSLAAASIGAGAVVAAGLIAVFFCSRSISPNCRERERWHRRYGGGRHQAAGAAAPELNSSAGAGPDQRPNFLRATRRGWRSTSPSCRSCCGSSSGASIAAGPPRNVNLKARWMSVKARASVTYHVARISASVVNRRDARPLLHRSRQERTAARLFLL